MFKISQRKRLSMATTVKKIARTNKFNLTQTGLNINDSE